VAVPFPVDMLEAGQPLRSHEIREKMKISNLLFRFCPKMKRFCRIVELKGSWLGLGPTRKGFQADRSGRHWEQMTGKKNMRIWHQRVGHVPKKETHFAALKPLSRLGTTGTI
jgi:hypothetical protein